MKQEKDRSDLAKELQQSEIFLANVFESIQDGISILDKDLNILRVNSTMEEWYEHAAPLVGKKCYSAYHGRKERCDVCPSVKALETGGPAHEVVSKTGPNGEISGWFDLYSFPLRGPKNGEISGVIEYVRDISERVFAEDALLYQLGFEEIVSRTAANFINLPPERIDEEIIVALEQSARYIDAVRACIFIFSDDHSIITITHEWSDNPSDLLKSRIQQLPSTTFSYILEKLKDGESLELTTLDELPPEAEAEREWVMAHGKSTFRPQLFVPMTREGELQGALGFYGMRDVERQWPEHIDSMLRVMGTTIISAMEHKRSERELRESERRHRTLVESMTDLIFVFDESDRYSEFYASSHHLLVSPVEDLMHRHISEVLPDEVVSGYLASTMKVRESGEPQIYDYSLVIDNNVIWFSATLMLHEDGKRVVAVVRDVTGRRGVEEALRESEERLELALEGADLGVWDLDAKTRIAVYSNRYAEILGYRNGEIDSSSSAWEHRIHPDDREAVLKIWKNHFEGRTELYSSEHRVKTKAGDWKWVLDMGRVVDWDADGTALRATGILQDISERHQIEDALRASEQRFRELITFTPEGIGISDLDENLVFVNEAFTMTLGYSADELTSMTIFDLILPTERERLVSETELRRTGESSVYYLEMIKKDGEIIIARISSVPRRDDQGTVVGAISVVTDVTAQRRAQEELSLSNKELELYGSLLRHDIRNDLHIIMATAEFLALESSLDARHREHLESIQASSQRMFRLLTVMGRPSKADRRDIIGILRIASAQAEQTHPGLRIELRIRGVGPDLRASGGRLMMAVFDNIFRNAAEYSGPTPEIIVEIEPVEAGIRIDISDNGPGIPKAIRAELFQSGVSTTGGGYGLYLTRKLVETYGGSIELLEESVRKGAAFRIILPLV